MGKLLWEQSHLILYLSVISQLSPSFYCRIDFSTISSIRTRAIMRRLRVLYSLAALIRCSNKTLYTKFHTGSFLARPRQDHRARNARRNAMFTGEEQLASSKAVFLFLFVDIHVWSSHCWQMNICEYIWMRTEPIFTERTKGPSTVTHRCKSSIEHQSSTIMYLGEAFLPDGIWLDKVYERNN